MKSVVRSVRYSGLAVRLVRGAFWVPKTQVSRVQEINNMAKINAVLDRIDFFDLDKSIERCRSICCAPLHSNDPAYAQDCIKASLTGW